MSSKIVEKLTEKFAKLNVKYIDKVIKIQRRYKQYLANKNILSLNNWEEYYKKIKNNYKESQYDYYKRNNASVEVLQLVAMGSKRFGSISEKLTYVIFKLEPRTSSENDGVRKGKKIEIKCARYWGCKNECKWQHLELEHDYDCVLFGLLDFDGSWKFWGISKTLLFGELKEKNIVSYQGKQGYWCDKSKVIKFCHVIKSIKSLDKFLETI